MTAKEKIISIVKPFIYILPGIVLAMNPKTSILAVCYIMGACALIYGISRIVTYFRSGADTPFRVFSLFIGIAVSIFGFICVAMPSSIASIIPFMFGIVLIFDSVMKLQHSLISKSSGIRTWWLELILTVLVFAAGIFLVFNAFGVMATAVRLFGIFLIIDGVLDIGKAVYFILDSRN